MASRRSLTDDQISLWFDDNDDQSDIGEFDPETEVENSSESDSEHEDVWALDQQVYRRRAARSSRPGQDGRSGSPQPPPAAVPVPASRPRLLTVKPQSQWH